MGRIAVLTFGLWKLRDEIATLTGMTPVRWHAWSRPSFDAVAGWGRAPTAEPARRLAERSGKPYLAFEDGPLRSVRPGPKQAPMSMVMDRSGIYYDAGRPSDLVGLIADEAGHASVERAKCAAEQLKRLRLSKYNAGPERSPKQLGLSRAAAHRVLVLDQVRDDASIRGGLADAACFEAMLAAARTENPGSEIVVKLHPDVLSGRRRGYYSDLLAALPAGVKLIAESVNPWSLLDLADSVYTVSSGLGFEAALAGKAVTCFGSPFYAGWGFTDDRRPKVTRPRAATPLQVFAAYYLRYARYFDAYSRKESTFERASEQLAFLRDRFLEQHRRAVSFRISRWKRGSVDRMLDGPAGQPLHAARIATAVDLARRNDGLVVAWASRDNTRLRQACERAGVPFVQVEDGFVRSAGLGASFVQPLSLVFDAAGIYYDPRTPSDLELLLQEGDFSPEILERARRLRGALIGAGTTKYNVQPGDEVRIESDGRPIVLVPGQVEDDASIRRGSPRLSGNLDLLRAVRERHPDKFILYKPHPDVEAGFRRGNVPPRRAAEFADRIVSNASILQLLSICDRVETITSLAGFEALLRGKPVTTHGQPFFAGWGLTEDLCPVPRRTRRRSLDELVAASLILYPRYTDPVTGLVCGPELLIERLAASARRQRTAGERAIRVAQVSAARALYIGRSVKQMARRGA